MDHGQLANIERFCKIADQKNEDSSFLIFDIDDVIGKLNHWKKRLPRIDPYYAVKSNSDPVLLRTLAALNVGFDCASKGEIETIVNLGVPVDRIIYANTCKGFSHLRYAADLKVELMTFDNEDELLKIKQLCPSAKLLLRLKIRTSSGKVQMKDKFGCDETEVPLLLEVALQNNLSVVGVSFHVGVEIENPDDYVTAISKCRKIFDIAGKKGIKMYLLDIGGGFPGSLISLNGSRKTKFDEIAEAVNLSIDEHFPANGPFKIIAEPGRYFCSSAFTLCSKIIGRKQCCIENEEDIMYFINEGIYGLFLHTVMHDFQVVVKEMWPGHKTRKRSSIWGQSCDPTDLIVKKCMIPELQVGDWIVFEDMGAYRSSCATTFNGFEKTEVKHTVSKRLLNQLEKPEFELNRTLFEAGQPTENHKKIKRN